MALGIRDIAGVTATLVVAVIILVVGTIIFQELHDDNITTATKSIANETITLVNGTGVSLAHDNIVAESESLYIMNGSIIRRGADYYITNTSGLITLRNNDHTNNVTNATYDFTQQQRDAVVNVTDSGSSAILNLTGQFPLLGTVIIFAVIIGVLLVFFRLGGGRSGGGMNSSGV